MIGNSANQSDATPQIFMLPKRYVSGLSKEVLYDLLGLVVSKLETLKVCGQKKVETFWVRGYFSAIIIVIAALWASQVRFPDNANFEAQQFCSPLVYKNIQYLF